MSSTRTFSGPRSSARRSAAARSASLVARFFRSRKSGRCVITPQRHTFHARTQICVRAIFLLTSGRNPPNRKGPTPVRGKGMAYDTGFVRNGSNSRERFEPELVRQELTIIRDDLHCNAVQIIGGDPQRLDLAARHAADLGLEVWFSPYPMELTAGEMLALFVDCAERAERLRTQGAEVVFVAGVELSIMNRGF